jgi:hypothetical protein
MVMTPFGKRSQLYERLQSGEVDRMRQRRYSQYKEAAPAERMLRFVKATEISEAMTLAFSLRAERFIPTAEQLFAGDLVLILAADPVETLRVLCQDRFFVILA